MTTTVRLTLGELAGRTGRGVSVAVVDSGIHPSHPHVSRIAGGIALDDEGRVGGDVMDRLGHGTAVAAAIHEKAPDAVLVAVKVFDRSLRTSGRALVEAIQWAAVSRVSIVNLSLGTVNQEHAAALGGAIDRATAAGTIVIAAAPEGESHWLPGALPGVLGVEVGAALPRDVCELVALPGVGLRARASPLPRPIPGVPPERNLQGASFAVANTTGILALALEGAPARSVEELVARYRLDEGGTMPLIRK